LRAEAVGSRSLDNVAVWVNEGGAGGGGYSMKALRTLVVEDDAIIGGLLAETLEGLGHAVCAVENNVANAMAAASHWRPDLMIVDVGLGEASGIAAVKEILRSRFVPHVFVTGDKVRGMPLGPDTVLIQKPFRVSDLDQAIQRALAVAPVWDRVAEDNEKVRVET
jgi:DNA-binding response OmpR family regulator